MPLKIAMIGAGSIGFTRRLMADLLTVPEFAETTFAFTDLNSHNLDMVKQLAERDIAGNGLPAKIVATTDRRAAIADCDYVICMIRQGGLEGFQTDIDIPLKYGIDQCVGDTICAGGIMYAQRGIAALLDFCKDIREVAKPGALFLNYSNPMAMLTWACNKYGGVQTVGLCHGVQGAQHQIADCVTHWARKEGLIGEDEKVHRKDIEFTFAGINHQTWCLKAVWREFDLIPMLLSLFENHPRYPETEKVRIDVLKRFGYYSTESNGHLSEYVPWYRKRLDEITKWIDLSSWINGETGGYLRVCTEGRNWFETDFPNWLTTGTAQVHAGEAQRRTRLLHPRSPGDRADVSRSLQCAEHGHYHQPAGRLHHRVAGLCGSQRHPHGAYRRPAAGVCGDVFGERERAADGHGGGGSGRCDAVLKQAMLHDPLVGAVCDPEEVWQMTDEMLVAQAEWLPQYVASIPAAKARLAEHEANGTRVKTMEGFEGMARLHTKTVEEMASQREEARKNAQAADKGKMTQNA